MKKDKKYISDLPKILLIVFCIVLFIVSYFIRQKKNHINEAKKLPFSNTNIELVEDGTYENSTITTFMHLTLQVTVQDKKIKNINVIENEGAHGKKEKQIIENMISNNKVVTPLVDGDELGNLVFISCVDGALKKGVPSSN